MTGPPSQACFAHTGWDTNMLAPFPSLALKVLLNATQKVKCLNKVGHLTKSVDHTQSTIVGYLKFIC